MIQVPLATANIRDGKVQTDGSKVSLSAFTRARVMPVAMCTSHACGPHCFMPVKLGH